MRTCLIIILLHVSSLHLKAKSINKIIEPTNHNQPYKYALVTEYKGKVALLGKYPIGSTITLMDHSKGKTFNTYAKSVKIRYDEYAGNVTITTLANQPPGSSISTEAMFQMTAIINTPVKNYVALKVVSISDHNLIANTDKLVRASGVMSKILNQNSGSTDPKSNKIYLDALNNKLPLVNKVIVPGMDVYV